MKPNSTNNEDAFSFAAKCLSEALKSNSEDYPPTIHALLTVAESAFERHPRRLLRTGDVVELAIDDHRAVLGCGPGIIVKDDCCWASEPQYKVFWLQATMRARVRLARCRQDWDESQLRLAKLGNKQKAHALRHLRAKIGQGHEAEPAKKKPEPPQNIQGLAFN
jgi:hypothetical protein